jgi:hypothetical protein
VFVDPEEKDFEKYLQAMFDLAGELANWLNDRVKSDPKAGVFVSIVAARIIARAADIETQQFSNIAAIACAQADEALFVDTDLPQ